MDPTEQILDFPSSGKNHWDQKSSKCDFQSQVSTKNRSTDQIIL